MFKVNVSGQKVVLGNICRMNHNYGGTRFGKLYRKEMPEIELAD